MQTNDRTTEAVKNQLRAMGCRVFEIGIKNEKGMINKEYTEEEIVKAIPYLKRMNAQGNDIYIRPAAREQSALILLDDLEQITIDEMRENGLAPAAVIETSFKNCQAWLKLCPETLSDALRSEIAKKLAHELGGDIASAEKRHYGRLAGFTNQKEKYLTERGFPFVLCRSSTGEIAKNGGRLIEEARIKISQKSNKEEELKKPIGIEELLQYRNPDIGYKRYMQEWLMKQRSNEVDWSKGDYAVACRMIIEGYEAGIIAKAMAENSPNIGERKKNHIIDYIERTILNASRNQKVLQKLREKEQHLSKDDGLSR